MISGDLIRLKNLIDDCVRVAKSIQREAERLTAEELAHLNEYIQGSAPQFKDILKKVEPAPGDLAEKTGPANLKIVNRP